MVEITNTARLLVRLMILCANNGRTCYRQFLGLTGGSDRSSLRAPRDLGRRAVLSGLAWPLLPITRKPFRMN